MLLRFALFVVLGLGLFGFGTVFWFGTRPPPPPAPLVAAAPAPLRSLVIATSHTVRTGTLLRPEDIAPVEMPPDAIPRGARRDSPTARNEVLGALVRHPIGAGQPVLPDDIVRPGDHGFLAAVLAPGTRAVAVGVDAVAGTAGLIWPGDRVDVILTQSLDDKDASPGHRIAGETVLHDVRVIAVDQDLTQGATPGAIPGGGQPNARPTSRTVTLEVTPGDAERVAVATRLGKLSLSVVAAEVALDTDTTPPIVTDRADVVSSLTPAAAVSTASINPVPAAANTSAKAPAVTWGGDVSTALGAHEGPKTVIRVFDGSNEGKEFKF
jgi:pilus assembly protein CpaB